MLTEARWKLPLNRRVAGQPVRAPELHELPRDCPGSRKAASSLETSTLDQIAMQGAIKGMLGGQEDEHNEREMPVENPLAQTCLGAWLFMRPQSFRFCGFREKRVFGSPRQVGPWGRNKQTSFLRRKCQGDKTRLDLDLICLR